jgi:rare lipoprotein A
VYSTKRNNGWLWALERAAMVAAMLIGGCSTTAAPAPAIATTPPAYSRNRVEPSSAAQRPVKQGHVVTASRYAGRLAGNCTSNGETYNPKSLTAASRTLPMGSTVKVTNVDNGRSVKVRINDRGPYVHGRSLDLSGRAAENIGLDKKGVAKVKVSRQAVAAAAPSTPCE